MDDFNKNDNFNEAQNGFDGSNYTPNPEEGFYNKQKEDIIQDTPPVYNSYDSNGNPQYQTYSYTPNYSNENNYYSSTPQKPKKEKRKFGFGTIILSAVLAAVIGAVSSLTVYTLINKAEPIKNIISGEEKEEQKNNLNITIDETVESVVEAVSLKATPSVIGIRTTITGINFFGQTNESSGEGSGVIYSEDGYIITNYHVIENALSYPKGSKIEVFLTSPSDDPYEATVVGYNISADIAVIKINAKNLTAIEIADSDELNVGEYVITIGSPGGLEFMGSVTYGIVSGLNRVVSADSDIELIQTDAAINPGNSGGALVNTKGQLVGINSSKIVAEEFEGMGFAIPSNTTIEICKKIIENEGSPEPYIGITVSEKYTSKVLERYGYPNGAVVLSVANSSPAYNAGIERGDIITEYGGNKITEYSMLEEFVAKSTPGQKVNVTLYRNGHYYSTSITVGSNNQID